MQMLQCVIFSASSPRESTCKMLLLKSYFTPRVLLKITFTPIYSCVFLVPRHFYPLKHTRMCILSNNGTQAIQLFPSLLLSTERWRTEKSRLANRCERKPRVENSMKWKCHHSYCYQGMGGKQHSSAPDQTLELIVRLQSFKIWILRAEPGQVAVQSESLLSLEGNKKVKDRHQGHRKKVLSININITLYISAGAMLQIN